MRWCFVIAPWDAASGARKCRGAARPEEMPAWWMVRQSATEERIGKVLPMLLSIAESSASSVLQSPHRATPMNQYTTLHKINRQILKKVKRTAKNLVKLTDRPELRQPEVFAEILEQIASMPVVFGSLISQL